MNRISYQYTNVYKQIFLILYMFYLLLCASVIAEIVIFDIPGYEIKVLNGLLIYSMLMITIFFIFRGYKFFYTTYNGEKITYHNILLRRSRSIDIDSVRKIIFYKKGVKFYTTDFKNSSLYIPFYRGGIIDAIEIDKFYKTVKTKNNIEVIKEFRILPGYGKLATILKVIYIFLTVYAFLSCIKPLVTIIVLFQNFA